MGYRAVGVALVAFLVGLTVLTGTVRYTEADTRGTLLVSEQLIDNGTIALDAYDPAYLSQHYNFMQVDGHYYDFFPLGTSILAVPGAAAAKALGIDVFDKRGPLEILIAAFVAAGIVVALFLLARQFVGYGDGTHPRSRRMVRHHARQHRIDGAVVAWLRGPARRNRPASPSAHRRARRPAALALARSGPLPRLALPAHHGPPDPLRPGLPDGAVTPRCLGGGSRDRRSPRAVRRVQPRDVRPVAARLLPARLATETFGEALAGHLISPSRGLLVFTPVLLVLPLLALLIVALGWPLAHWIVVSRHPQWYGGFSYGPRLMTDALPGLFLALVLLWPASLRSWSSRAVVGLGIMLAAFGVWVHTVQGLHNNYTFLWNSAPMIEDRPDKAWDWRYPQFLNDADRESRRLADYGGS